MFNLELRHCANPDISELGGYWDHKPSENNIIVEVENLQAAREVCRSWIDRLGLGSGNWIGGKVFEAGKLIAQIAFNGRIQYV